MEIEIRLGQVTLNGEKIIVENARNGADFVIYAPTGSTWQVSGNKYTSSLNGNNYWSLVMLPQNASSINTVSIIHIKPVFINSCTLSSI